MPPRTADTSRKVTTRASPERSGMILTSPEHSIGQYSMQRRKVAFDTVRHPFYDANRPFGWPQTAMLSIPHMIVVFVVVLVVFGPQKLPELARGFGKLMAEFRKASTDFKTPSQDAIPDLDHHTPQAAPKKL